MSDDISDPIGRVHAELAAARKTVTELAKALEMMCDELESWVTAHGVGSERTGEFKAIAAYRELARRARERQG
jgi:molecular chaperone GrpE (heat shock protein)